MSKVPCLKSKVADPRGDCGFLPFVPWALNMGPWTF